MLVFALVGVIILFMQALHRVARYIALQHGYIVNYSRIVVFIVYRVALCKPVYGVVVLE